MVVANENDLFARLKNGAEFKRNELFDTLVKGSQRFLKGGKGMVMNGTLENTTHFGFWMEGYWQGKYDKYLKVSKDGRASNADPKMSPDRDIVHYYMARSYMDWTLLDLRI